MEDPTLSNTNGFHTSAEALKKRKSQSSPISDNHEFPPIVAEPKRPKMSDVLDGASSSSSSLSSSTSASVSSPSSAQRNTEVTQVEFNEMLSTIFQVVQGMDRERILVAVTAPVAANEDTSANSIMAIRSKLKESEYSSASSFKDDIARVCNAAILDSKQTAGNRETAKRLLQLATDLISDKSHYTIRSHGKKVRSREESQTSLPERDYENVALFQRGHEGGFVFSSKAIVKDDTLDKDLSKSVIVPVVSAAEPPLLKDINTKPRPARRSVTEQSKKKNFGVEYCTYSPFTSFAPFVDSSNAELNAEETAIAYDALLEKHAQKSTAIKPEDAAATKKQLESILKIAEQQSQQENGSGSSISEADLSFLAKEGLDVASLLQTTTTTSPSSKPTDTTSMSPVEIIQHNAILLFELHKLQEERFSSKNQTVGVREREIATQLQNSLLRLASQVPSSKLVSSQAIEETIRKLPYKEPAFAGTLPPNKAFAFPTSTTRAPLPATATAYPLHTPVAVRKPAQPTTVIPQVALSPHLNMTGGYPTVPQSHQYHYSAPQQPTSQKTYSRPRPNNATATTLVPIANGDITFRKNLHTVVTIGSTPAHWRRNDSQTPCANCGTLVSPIWRLGARNEKLCNACGQYNKKWNGQQRPISLFPNTEVPTFRK
ncbi:hypothetical protein BGZ83_010209 [Gryganskiella cystojenkinii]|nr:hypothetical protein BGZ83_010209 [Gryganskiella cystojenkinii]